MTDARKKLWLGMGCDGHTGWGLIGTHLAYHATKRGWDCYAPSINGASWPIGYRMGEPFVRQSTPAEMYDLALVACGNHHAPPRPLNATRAVALPVIEDTAIRPDFVETLNTYDRVIAASSWNQALLTNAGVRGVQLVHQAIDGGLDWTPPRRGVFGGRRAIFSGGKLEFRKGQDIVVAAFREHLKADPDAILVTAWQNVWPQTMKGIDAMGYVKGWPATNKDGSLDIVSWCVKNGIPRRNVIDVGLLPNWAMPSVLAECDVAVFPNRCEGGTNLGAMECHAALANTWVTDATGQADLAGPLTMQPSGPVTAKCSLYDGTDGWAETDPAVVAAAMAATGAREHPAMRIPRWTTATADLLRVATTDD